MKLSSFKPTLKKVLIVSACLILIVAFIPFTGANISSSIRGNSVIKVGEYNVNPNIIKADMLNYLRMYQMQGVQPNQRDFYNMLNRSVQNNVVKYLYVNESSQLGIEVHKNIVNEAIAGNPYFRNEEGKFDKDIFINIVNTQFKNEQEFKDTLKTDIALTMFGSAFNIPLSFPPQILEYAYKGLNQIRDIEYIVIDKNNIKDLPEVTEDFIQKTYNENKASFTIPEYRDIELVYFDVSDFNNVKPSNEEITKYYKDNIANYKEQDLYEISQAIFSDEKSANEMHKKLQDGTLDEKSEGFVELGSIDRAVVRNIYNYDIANQNTGSFSKPLKTEVGYHILFLKSIVEGKTIALSEVKQGIVDTLSQQKQQLAIENFKVNFSSKAKNANFTELAKSEGKLKYIKYQAVNKEGLSKESKTAVKVLGGQSALENFFSLKQNTTTPFMQDGSYFYIAKVTNIENSYVRNIEDVKPEIEKAWQTTQQHIKALEIANAINASNINVNNIKADGYSVKKSSVSLVNNSLNNSILTYSNVQSVFNLNKYENTIIDNPDAQFIAVVKLTGIRSGSVNKKQYEAFKMNMSELLNQMSSIGFLNYLYNKYEIKIDEEKLSQIIFSQQ